MERPVSSPPEVGELDGLAYALFLPAGSPRAGVVILHGAGSAKESHFDFAERCRVDGMAALAFDARGHGGSTGEFGPGAIDDVLAMIARLAEEAPALALRGSSMGGFQAIHAAAREPSVCAVVAICPAPEESLRNTLRSGDPQRFRCDAAATERWLGTLDIRSAVARLGPATALLLMHARGDEQIPWTVSRDLHEAARKPKRLVAPSGGDHRSLQHDPEMQALSSRWIARFAAREVHQ